jgi:hypothetical protein
MDVKLDSYGSASKETQDAIARMREQIDKKKASRDNAKAELAPLYAALPGRSSQLASKYDQARSIRTSYGAIETHNLVVSLITPNEKDLTTESYVLDW